MTNRENGTPAVTQCPQLAWNRTVYNFGCLPSTCKNTPVQSLSPQTVSSLVPVISNTRRLVSQLIPRQEVSMLVCEVVSLSEVRSHERVPGRQPRLIRPLPDQVHMLCQCNSPYYKSMNLKNIYFWNHHFMVRKLHSIALTLCCIKLKKKQTKKLKST